MQKCRLLWSWELIVFDLVLELRVLVFRAYNGFNLYSNNFLFSKVFFKLELPQYFVWSYPSRIFNMYIIELFME